MIPLIRYGESPKNPTPVQKTVEVNSIAAGRPATEDISFTGQKLPLSCHSLLRLLRLLLTWSGHGSPEAETGIRINIRRWRTKLQAVLSAAGARCPSIALLLLLLLLLLPRVETRPARKQMSDDHLVHSRHNGNDDLKPSRSPSRRPGYWITGRYSTLVPVCVHIQFSYRVWCNWRNCASVRIVRLLKIAGWSMDARNTVPVIDFRKLKDVEVKKERNEVSTN